MTQQSVENPAEARVEAITAGLLVLVFALFLLLNLSQAVAMMAAGLVLLGSGIYQSRQGWHVAITTWLLGVILFLGGLGVRTFLVAYLEINWVAISLGLVGITLIWQMVTKK